MLDRIGGPGRAVVTAQLKHEDPAFRALAVRILRRHGSEFGDGILALAADPAAEVRREVLLATRTIGGEQAEAALTQIAATYDGTDRYQLEAINIAAGDRKAELLARLEKDQPLSAAQFPLVELLAPDRAAKLLLARLTEPKLDEASARKLLAAAVNIPSLDAGWGLLELAQDADRPAALRRRARDRVGQRGRARRMVGDGRGPTVRDGARKDARRRELAIDRGASYRATANRVASAAVARPGP